MLFTTEAMIAEKQENKKGLLYQRREIACIDLTFSWMMKSHTFPFVGKVWPYKIGVLGKFSSS